MQGFLANMYEKVMASKMVQTGHQGYDGECGSVSMPTVQSSIPPQTTQGSSANAITYNGEAQDFLVLPHSPLFVTETYDPGSVESANITREQNGTHMNDWPLPEVLVPFGRTFDNVNLDFQGLEELFSGQSMQFDSMAQWPLFGDIPND